MLGQEINYYYYYIEVCSVWTSIEVGGRNGRIKRGEGKVHMNHYDNEENIIRNLQSVPLREVHLVNPTREVTKFFFSLYRERRFENWTNNFRKDVPPPDFFSKKYGYMLEVMRIDDYVAGNNSPNALESKFVKKIEDMRRKNGLPTLKESNVHMFIIPDMSKASENGYSIYIENFKRIVQKHIDKIKNYRENHPGYKLGFLIFDEAPGYLRVTDKIVKVKAGESVSGFPHFHFVDKNLIESFLEADVDFFIWMTPYKNLPSNPRIYPQICVFDMKRKDNWKKRLIEYNVDEMMCLEVE